MLSSFQWTKEKPTILSPESLSTLENAFHKGIVLGDHYFYCGGRGPDHVAFFSYSAFLDYLNSRPKPGDLFVLWSLPELLQNETQLLSGVFSAPLPPGSLGIPDEKLVELKHFLQILKPISAQYYMNEVRAVYYSSEEQIIETKIYNLKSVDDWEKDWQEILDDIRRYSHPGGQVHFFNEDVLFSGEYEFLSAKYPNENGEVPIGGAY